MNETFLTIYVTFEGLGFACFNPDRKGAEIAFLRLPEHNLKIQITGSNGKRKTFDDIADNAKIELLSKGTLVDGFRLNADGEFNRRVGFDSDNDPLDLRWHLDLEGSELHGTRATPQSRVPNRSVRALTEMFLPNAYFFTEQVLTNEYSIQRINTSTNSTTSENFGLIGDTLGAKIDAVTASLRIDGNDVFCFDDDIKPQEVTRFFVNITNLCVPPPGPPQSDFQKYYEVLNFQDNVRFDFKAQLPLAGESPWVCEFALLSKSKSLADFFE